MRKFLLFVALCAAELLLSQNWCPAGATWRYRDYNTQPGVYKDGTLELAFTNTITINNIVCKELKGTFYGAVVPGSPSYTIQNYVTYRTYESNSVAYIFNVSSQSFDTIADFNAHIGDTWNYALYNAACQTQSLPHSKVTVYDTGHVTINGMNLRKLVVSPPSATLQSVFIERIGGMPGFLFQPEICNQDGSTLGDFSCYSDNNFLIYKKPGVSDCYFNTVSIAESARSNVSARLYPNPNNGNFTLALNQAGTVFIYNSLGALVHHTAFGEPGNFTMAVSHLQRGLYFLETKTASGSGYVKFTLE